MKVIDYNWKKRNGNGHSTCHLCKTLIWDNFCYDFELKILNEKLFNTVLCGYCISKIKNELKCKMTISEKLIEKEQDIEELTYENTFKGNSDMEVQEILANKINDIIKEVNKLKNK